MRVEIVTAKPVDIHDVIKRSPIANNPNAEHELKHFLGVSVLSWTGLLDGRVACVWGLIAPTILSEKAYLWLLTTDLIDEHPFTFIRHSQIVLREMLKSFKYIEGHVVADSTRSIRWLKWLGFELHRRNGKLIEFHMRSA